MALVLADRVQQTGTANTTVSFTLSGSVTGYQSFAVVGNGNTTYYAATDGSGNWEVGIGTYSTTGPTLTRTTILSSSNSGSAVTFPGPVNVFVTYPSEKSVNLNGSGNVSALGTVSSGVWQGTAVAVGYGGTGLTSFTANGVVYASSTSALTTGTALVFDGTTLATTGKFGISGSGSLPTATAIEIGTNGAGSRMLFNVPTGGEHDFNVNGSLASWVNATSSGWYISGSEQMRLTSTGLGIGTSSPAVKLDILGSTPFVRLQENTTGYLGFRGQNTSGNFYFGIDSSTGNFYGSAYARVLYSDGAYPMVFYTNAIERMRIDSSGNLLVGTTTNTNSSKVVSSGVIESTTGGFRFPDGTTQTTAGSVSSVNGKTGTVQSVVIAGTAVASTSGTAIDFTSIPSWVKRITVMFNGVSTNSTSVRQIQLGYSGGVETTGYTGSVATTNSSGAGNNAAFSGAGFALQNSGNTLAADSLYGNIVFTNVSGNIWTGTGILVASNQPASFYVAGVKTTSGVLTTVRITTVNGTDTFDAGSINILYE